MGTDRAATLNVRPLAIAGLKNHPQNYNLHSPAQLAELVRSIRRHGAYKNAVVSADGYILAGHGILEAARREGWKQWPCERRDYDHDHPDALNLLLTDNEVGNPANPLGPDPDQALLAALARQVAEETGLEGTGLDDARLAVLLAATAEPLDWSPDPDADGAGTPWSSVSQTDGATVRLLWGEVEAPLSQETYARVRERLAQVFADGTSWSAWLTMAFEAACSDEGRTA